MKTVISIFVSLLMLSSCTLKRERALSVAFYNCENLFDTTLRSSASDSDFTPHGRNQYSRRVYEQKLHNIATVIQSMGKNNDAGCPVIIGLAEIESEKVLDDLVNEPEIAREKYSYAITHGSDARGINVALLYKPELFIIIKVEALKVDLNQISEGATTRDILHFEGMLNRDTVHVYVNHWTSKAHETGGERERGLEAQTLMRSIALLRNKYLNSKIIIMGDFNENPNEKELLRFQNNENLDNRQFDFLNPFMPIYDSGFGTEFYRNKWNLFDQILVNSSLTTSKENLYFDKAEIFNPDFLVINAKNHLGEPYRSFLGNKWINGYSDHFPVIVFLISKY